VLLPIAPFTETSGSFVSTEGRVQGFHAAVRPLGETRPAWKVLRVLGGLLGLEGFDYESVEQVREECLRGKDIAALLSNATRFAPASAAPGASGGLQRVADVPIYFADPLARRSPPLQRTRDAAPPRCRMNAGTMQGIGLAAGQPVRVRMGQGEAELIAELDAGVPDGCVRIAAAHAATARLGPMFGAVSVEAMRTALSSVKAA
jgi:NADH-quinone oxidoreductase subunit G